MSEAEEDFFEMANLFPSDTGLPMVVWVSERGHARHDVRVKVNQSHGTRMLPGNLAVVAVRPAPRLVAGNLSPDDLSVVSDWIRLNEPALVDYWEYRISTRKLIQQLRRLPATGAGPQRPAARTTTLHTISFAKSYDQSGRMWVQFDDDLDAVIDLSPFLAQGGVFEPLRDFQHFAAVEVGANGRSIIWRIGEDIFDLSADTLWLMAHPVKLHTITWVKPVSGGRLNLSFNDDPTKIELVDLSAMLAQGGVFEPLRDPAVFAGVELGPDGHTVLWHVGEGVVDLGADALWLMAHPGDRAPATQ
jgi:hypothetical protein